ncbi:uncharacterized protein LOC101857346 isoform X2 [Aplysia californica]|uniref:Uncharacterized protein LOC101857346 isoform X1 n=1 Tax=Aplysia californica TaxID=6500 RepID=A0ABM1A398_APLCA|nr:uncharacterized protein LOC101857346 isoform X1 [Aplysia californica]XP_012939941.1 uncharacterized protein LOC101857346 isoform X2 [Aplysia californica]
MKQGVLFNLVGTVLIVAATVLHIVCLSTPYYTEVNMDEMAKKMEQRRPGGNGLFSQGGMDSTSMDESDEASNMEDHTSSIGRGLGENGGMGSDLMSDNGGFDESPVEGYHEASSGVVSSSALDGLQGKINFGIWKFCVSVKNTFSACMEWTSQDTASAGTGIGFKAPGWLYGVQAMAVIGSIIVGIASVLSVINLVRESKGDRLRLLYLIIAATCVAGGVFILIGDIIMASKYSSVLDGMAQGQVPPQTWSFIKDQFYLSWGFALDVVSVAMAVLAGVAHVVAGRAALSANGVV